MSNETENHIIEIARREFVKHGYECTSMSEIAAQAGINRPTLHYYFRTKEKMFQAVFAEIVETLLPAIGAVLQSDIPFMQKLEFVIDKYHETFLHNPDIPYFIFNEIQRDTAHLVATAQELNIDVMLKAVEKALHDGIARGELREVDTCTLFHTFYALLVFPIIGKNLTMEIFFAHDEAHYREFLAQWKAHMLSVMGNLLCK